MRVFSNPVGDGVLFFDNVTTPNGVAVAYDPATRSFVSEAHFCANRDVIGCNWVASAPGALCDACTMTALSPDASMPDALENWARSEAAKRWVLDNLRRWRWFGPGDTGPSPAFHMLAEGANPVVMGHATGVVTISVEEADPALRVSRREALGERYRTMIGHMRHEIAHVLWWRLNIVPEFLEEFRTNFGDERADYAGALEQHYTEGPSAGWEDHFLTPYASAHPHEDWAETTAHLLHIVDITDSFLAAGFAVPDGPDPEWDPYAEPDLTKLTTIATPIVIGVNHVNRSMGLPDLYPFVLSDRPRKKVELAHRWLREGLQNG